jgi:ABC-type lipoprotein release transport system permease subunit
MTEHIDRNLMLRKIPARMFVVLGPLLVVLAAIGVYAAVAYTVSQRTAEIGLRLALGATAARVARDVTAPAWGASVAGIVMGTLLVAMIDLHLIRGGARDLVVVLGVPLLLAGVAGTACWWPARRAARLAPLSALRRE